MNDQAPPRVAVGALLSQERMIRKVRAALRGKAALHEFSTWRELAEFIEGSGTAGVILDPGDDWPGRLAEALASAGIVAT